MKKPILVLVLICACLFSGCSSIFDGNYTSVTPHPMPNQSMVSLDKVTAKDRDELYAAVEKLVHNGLTGATVNISGYNIDRLEQDFQWISETMMVQDPIAAYAVQGIQFQQGNRNGKPELTVTVSYLADRSPVRGIQYVNNIQTAAAVIRQALDRCDEGVVLYVHNFESTDFVKIVGDYAVTQPQKVMELPQVTVEVYPEQGATRVVELRFSYQNSRDTLWAMQTEVEAMFEAALLYVSESAEPIQKFGQLGGFLMEHFDYHVATSITPTYSLLCEGVGDSKAFAVTYAAMCAQSGLECCVVKGEKAGEPYYWNIVGANGTYYHLDLMQDEFQLYIDSQMSDYIWDYEQYPECNGLMSVDIENNF